MTSRDPLDRPLHGVAVYNPDLLSKQELIAHFVARRSLFDRLVEDLGREGETQHHLIVGQRGMGKTTLLRRLRHAVEDDPQLDSLWIPLTFPEEQYNISRLSDLYLNCIDALGDALEQRGRQVEARKLDVAVASLPDRDEPERAARALDILLSQADRLGRRLLLLVDNLELIFDRLKEHQWGIRTLLSAEKRLLLIGASSAPIEITYTYKEPFYDFFQVHELRGLTEEETREVLLNLAHLDRATAIEKVVNEDPARIRTLQLLTGGNPRTIVLLYNVLAQGTDGDVRSDLERLLDQCTPLYKARFESLPAQAQKIVDALAIHWDPTTAGELAGALRMETNAVSSQLNRLAQQGVVEKVAYHPGNKTGFQIAERFFNIWYLMRASRRVRRRLIWLVEFLKLLYSGDEMRGMAKQHLRVHGQRQDDVASRLRHAEYGLALAQVVEDTPLRNALESTALRSLTIDRNLRRQISTIVDLEGADSSLKPMADRHRLAAEIQEEIASADIRWGDIDREHFAELLGGLPSLSIGEKHKLATSLPTMTTAELRTIFVIFGHERRHFLSIYRDGSIVNQLWAAIHDGYMVDANDVMGAEAASLSTSATELPAIALAGSLEGAIPADLTDVCTSLSKASSPFPSLIMGELLQTSAHRFGEAEAAFRNAIALDPTYARPWYGLGNLFQDKLGRFPEAETAYRKAIELDPTYAFAWYGLGSLFKDRMGRFADAESAYRAAIALDPTFASPWHELGRLFHNNLDRFAEADTAYRSAIELDPATPDPWYELGFLLQDKLNRFDDAESAYRTAIALDPTLAYPWFGLGFLYHHKMDRLDEAKAAYREAIDLDPASVHSWHALGDLFKDKLNRFDEAELAYRRGVDIDPQNASSWTCLGNLLAEAPGRFDEAETAYRRAIAVDLTDVAAWYGLSELLENKLGRFDEAEVAYRRAIDINPIDPYLWYRLGFFLNEKLGRVKEAEAAYRKAIDLDPAYPFPWDGLGDLLQDKLNRFDEAESAYRRAIDIEPTFSFSWYRLGHLLQYRLSRMEDAEAAYRRATTLDPSNAEAFSELAWLLYVTNKSTEAAEGFARRSVALDPDNIKLLRTLAIILARRGSWSEAAPIAHRFLAEGSANLSVETWPEIVLFFLEAARTSHAADAVALLDDLALTDRYRPLREALAAIAAGTRAYLRRVAPEIRHPAERLIDELLPAGLD